MPISSTARYKEKEAAPLRITGRGYSKKRKDKVLGLKSSNIFNKYQDSVQSLRVEAVKSDNEDMFQKSVFNNGSGNFRTMNQSNVFAHF